MLLSFELLEHECTGLDLWCEELSIRCALFTLTHLSEGFSPVVAEQEVNWQALTLAFPVFRIFQRNEGH